MSVTVHTTWLVPTGYASLALLTTLLTPQLSLVLAATPSTTAVARHEPLSALTVTSAGQLIEGSSVSLTVTVKVQLELLPEASVAVHTTLVVPFGKLDPDAGAHTIEPPTQLSVKLAVKLTLLLHCPGAALTVMFPGQRGTGRAVSLTVTEKLQLELLPEASVAVHTTLVVPFGKLNPDAGTHTIEPPTQLSM